MLAEHFERTPDQTAWDAFIAAQPHGYHEQTSVYGHMRGQFGYEADRVTVLNNSGHIVGGVQILHQRTPIGRLGMVLKAPIAVGDDPAILSDVVAAMDAFAASRRFASIRAETMPTQDATRQALLDHGYRFSKAWGFEGDHAYIHLQRSDDAQLADMGRKARNQIRGAYRKGVVVDVGGPDSIALFHKMHAETSDYHGFPTYPKWYYDFLYEYFSPDRLVCLIARIGDMPICGLICCTMGDRMYSCWFGMNRGVAQKQANATRILFFEAMKWGRAQGLSGFDLTGTSLFRKQMAHEHIGRPDFQRKHFGALSPLHRFAVETAGTHDKLRELSMKIGWRLGYFQTMPH